MLVYKLSLCNGGPAVNFDVIDSVGYMGGAGGGFGAGICCAEGGAGFVNISVLSSLV